MLLELGDEVYYRDSQEDSPIGTLIGIRETSWSDVGKRFEYSVLTSAGRIRRIYEEVITNVKPHEI